MSPVVDRSLDNAPPPEQICGTCPHCGSPLVKVAIWSKQDGYRPAIFCWAAIAPEPSCTYRKR